MRLLRFIILCLCLLLGISTGFAQDSKLLEQANTFVQNGNYKQALNLYSFYIRFHPHHIVALSERAVVYATLRQFEKAYNDIEQAFVVAGFSALDQAIIHNNRGQIYFLANDNDHALQDFSRAIELNPIVADYWLNRAILYQVLEEWDNALADYQSYLDLSPEDSEAYLNIARIYLAQEDLDSAIDGLDSAISITPDDPELYIFRGSLNLLREAYADAAHDYQNWMQLINIREINEDTLSNSTHKLVLDMSYGVMYRIPFEANSGDRLGVVANSATVDSLVVLLDPDGVPIMADDDGGRGLDSFILDFTLPANGTYTLLVGHARGGWAGKIELTLQVVADEGI